MPFKIVRNDITKVKADVIVNTANPNPICASGTDLAIYEAAGKEKLLAERANIGKIARGDIAVTGAYSLNAKYIIHTVGPVWTDGLHHEFEILEDCYRKSLQKALELKCDSIAFPLISTGVYGFPKDKALQIAVSVFSQFLTENEIEIILVVFDKRSFQLSGQIVGDIDSYIDANYVKESHRKEYPVRSRSNARMRELQEEAFYEEMLQREAEDNYGLFLDRRRICSFIEPRGAYYSLNHGYQQLIDHYKTYAEKIGKTKDTTIDSESHIGSVFFYHLQQRGCCNLELAEEDDVCPTSLMNQVI